MGGTQKVRRYRYRTPALTGPWRDSHEEAVGDAVKAKQAAIEGGSSELRWIVPGRIEERVTDEAPTRLRN
jgi:hypothetical protein